MSNDAVRAAIVQALARRAEARQGLVRQRLLQRVDELRRADSAVTAAARPLDDTRASAATLATLSGLVDRLGRVPLGNPQPPTSAGPGMPDSSAAPPLKAVTAHRATWARLRAEQRLRQALAQVPAKAGPLNSSQVVHRALQAMQALSPAYLDAFMSQVDTLLWLEQSSGAGDLSALAGARPRARPPRKA